MPTNVEALTVVCDYLATENVKLRTEIERMLVSGKAAARLNAELLDQVDELQQLREENARLDNLADRWRDLALFFKSEYDRAVAA